jgi:HAD superfamily hydrolase (TIGR01509 family)
MAFELPETVLFDLDGTLVDNFEAIHKCYNDVMKLMGLPPISYDEILKSVGGSVNVTVLKLAGEANAPTATRLFREHFPSVMFHGLRTYPGCIEILEALRARGIRTAVYTNKDDANSKKIISHLKLDGHLDGVFGTNVHPWRKPQAEFTHFVTSTLRADPRRTVMVGDSPFDIQTARNGGLAAIHCVATGSHTVEELAPYLPDTVHASLPELQKAVFGL